MVSHPLNENDLVERLANHKTVGQAPREELEWLAVHGTLRRLDVGDLLAPKGSPVEGLFIVLSGCISIPSTAAPDPSASWNGARAR